MICSHISIFLSDFTQLQTFHTLVASKSECVAAHKITTPRLCLSVSHLVGCVTKRCGCAQNCHPAGNTFARCTMPTPAPASFSVSLAHCRRQTAAATVHTKCNVRRTPQADTYHRTSRKYNKCKSLRTYEHSGMASHTMRWRTPLAANRKGHKYVLDASENAHVHGLHVWAHVI